jgi:hypothetical protein
VSAGVPHALVTTPAATTDADTEAPTVARTLPTVAVRPVPLVPSVPYAMTAS